MKMLQSRRYFVLQSIIGSILVAFACTVGCWVAYQKFFAWKRFEVVDQGTLYRSGLLQEWQLRRAIDRYHIKTLFSLTFTQNDAYQRICNEKGIKRYFAYLPGDGVGPDDPYLRFLEIASDPMNYPILVHCSAGVQRTGGAVALYRSVIQGWDFDDAITEMIAKGNDGMTTQIEQLRHLHEQLISSDRCLINIPRIASSRR